MKADNVALNHNLDLIVQQVVATVPVSSIILVGSRAKGEGVNQWSDYDLAVVLEWWQIPFFWKKLKQAERDIERRLNVKATLSPLPTFRLLKAKGNLYLLKMKKEGATLHGKEWLTEMDPGNAADVDPSWHFSYLATAMKQMLEHHCFGVSLDGQGQQTMQQRSIRETAKSILYCGEIYALLSGHYYAAKTEMVKALTQDSELQQSNPGFLEDLLIASSVWDGENVSLDTTHFWFKGRGHLVDQFQHVARKLLAWPGGNLEDAIRFYISKNRGLKLKNVQYTLLTWMALKQMRWYSLLSTWPVEDRLRMAVLRLLAARNEDGSVQTLHVQRAWEYLRPVARTPCSLNAVDMWEEMRDVVLTYWPYACVLGGI